MFPREVGDIIDAGQIKNNLGTVPICHHYHLLIIIVVADWDCAKIIFYLTGINYITHFPWEHPQGGRKLIEQPTPP